MAAATEQSAGESTEAVTSSRSNDVVQRSVSAENSSRLKKRNQEKTPQPDGTSNDESSDVEGSRDDVDDDVDKNDGEPAFDGGEAIPSRNQVADEAPELSRVGRPEGLAEERRASSDGQRRGVERTAERGGRDHKQRDEAGGRDSDTLENVDAGTESNGAATPVTAEAPQLLSVPFVIRAQVPPNRFDSTEKTTLAVTEHSDHLVSTPITTWVKSALSALFDGPHQHPVVPVLGWTVLAWTRNELSRRGLRENAFSSDDASSFAFGSIAATAPANSAPTLGSVTVGVPKADSGAVEGQVVGVDPDGDVLRYSGSITLASGSTVTVGSATGRFWYTPSAQARAEAQA
ncbi:hypothetical protein, partial [Mycolicibacterium sp. 018/SC-01/001]|uniref:hypothetical protein n=1 Tax=Mycolicibacterium sp. 018/SC-01/001 TaxID=2592069 RepID=UPI00351A7B23